MTSFGEDNLKEIRQMTNVGLSYPNLSQWQNWLAKILSFYGVTILM